MRRSWRMRRRTLRWTSLLVLFDGDGWSHICFTFDAGPSDGTVAVDETRLLHLAPDIETDFVTVLSFTASFVADWSEEVWSAI